MSIGFPDGQRITQWLGAPVERQLARAIGAAKVTDGPFSLASWASVVVAIKPTGGSVTVTVRQQLSGGPASLELDETVIVASNTAEFETFVLLGDTVYLDLTGSAPGVTVDYAVYPSNVTTNAQVATTVTGLTPGRGVDIPGGSPITVDHEVHQITGGGLLSQINGGIDGADLTLLAAGAAFSIDTIRNVYANSALGTRIVPNHTGVRLVYNSNDGIWYVAGVGS